MKHFIITRFNLRLEEWKTAKDGSLVLTDQWLEERFELFMNYCYPSVMNQSNQKFYWLVFFDTETPDLYKKKVENLDNQYENFTPLFVDGMKSLNTTLKQYISSQLDNDDKYIITSRLDNDDTIHQDFVSTIQTLAIEKDQTVIDIRKGYQINISNDVLEFRKYDNQFNPFVSLVETTSKFNTVLSRMHKSWKDENSIIAYQEKALWIEVIHTKNKLNFTRLDIPLARNVDLSEFGIGIDLRERSISYILINNFILTIKKPFRMIRDMIVLVFLR